jgi:ABC-2 type transport system permease protein
LGIFPRQGGVVIRLAAKLEAKNLRRDGAFAVAIGIFAALILFASVSSRRFIALENQSRIDAIVAVTAQTEAAREKSSPDTLRVGQELVPRIASLPLAPLAGVAVGQRQVLPQAFKLTTRPHKDEGSSMDASEAATGAFDLSFILVFLLPLLVIGASFDMLSREREQGTLAMVLSQPIRLSAFIIGKTATRAVFVVGATLALSTLGIFVAGAQPGPHAVSSYLLFAVLTLVYALFWFAIALAVNAYGRSSAGNALTLTVLWLLLVVVVPGLTSIAIDSSMKGPSRSELISATREAARETDQRVKQLEGNHGKASRPATEALALEKEFEAEIAPVIAGFEARRVAEQHWIDRARFLSPAMLMNEGLNDLSGSGSLRHAHFVREVDRFHREWRNFFEVRVLRSEVLTNADYDAMPKFQWSEPALSPVAARVAGAAIALGLASLALVLVAFRRFRQAH